MHKFSCNSFHSLFLAQKSFVSNSSRTHQSNEQDNQLFSGSLSRSDHEFFYDAFIHSGGRKSPWTRLIFRRQRAIPKEWNLLANLYFAHGSVLVMDNWSMTTVSSIFFSSRKHNFTEECCSFVLAITKIAAKEINTAKQRRTTWLCDLNRQCQSADWFPRIASSGF